MTEIAIPPTPDDTDAPKRQRNAVRIVRTALATARGRVGLALTLAVVLIAFVGPFVGNGSPNAFTTAPYQPPGGDGGLLGGDSLGRGDSERTGATEIERSNFAKTAAMDIDRNFQ